MCINRGNFAEKFSAKISGSFAKASPLFSASTHTTLSHFVWKATRDVYPIFHKRNRFHILNGTLLMQVWPWVTKPYMNQTAHIRCTSQTVHSIKDLNKDLNAAPESFMMQRTYLIIYAPLQHRAEPWTFRACALRLWHSKTLKPGPCSEGPAPQSFVWFEPYVRRIKTVL